MTDRELLAAADRLISYAQYMAETDVPNFEAWRATYREFLQGEDTELETMARHFDKTTAQPI